MLGSVRRAVAATLAVAAVASLAACGADRLPPSAARPTVPPPSSEPASTIDPDEQSESTAPEETSDPDETLDTDTIESVESTASTGDADPATTTRAVSAEQWAAFDAALSARLVGEGDLAAGVAVAVRGDIVHAADFGVRVPPPPPPDAAPSSVPETAGTAPADPGAAPLASVVGTDPDAIGDGGIAPDGAVPADAAVAPASVPPDAGEAIQTGDRFRIASISKVITAIVVLQLVEAGQIKLDDPVGERLAAIVGATVADPQASTVTVRQLLSHTGGFASYQSSFFGGRYDSCPAVAQAALGTGLATTPGTAYRYSNLNFCLLGLLIEDVAGRPYQAVVEDRLLEPLGIEGMRLAGTFDPDPEEVVHISGAGRNYMEVLAAAGAWVASPADLVTILASLDPRSPGFHPLSPPMAELMRRPLPSPPSNPAHWYGLGVMGFGDGSFGHTGTIEQTHAMVIHRADGVTWAITVSGQVPWETGDLRAIFDRALADAGIVPA